eukprot:8119656-Lingulodinium_polyedra.AAC.1
MKYEKAGRRACFDPMPVNFAEKGVFKAVHDKESRLWLLKHSFLEKQVELLDLADESGTHE